MPELPEVETITRHIAALLPGRIILDIQSDTPRLFRDHQNIEEVRHRIIGTKVEEVNRVGKNIILRLSNGAYLLLHLMMTGKIFVNPPEKLPHDRMKIEFSGRVNLIFNDVRKFGRCRVVSSIDTLWGKDALKTSTQEFVDIIVDGSGIVKTFLLNQKRLAGIGNIYADEILWYAGINPIRTLRSLSKEEIIVLYTAMRHVLELAVKKGGTSSRNYQKPDGSKGSYYKIRKVYHRTGEQCVKKDGGIIQRIVVGQRVTHFCPTHQI